MAPHRPFNVLDGMGEALLALARKHCTPQQWAWWLKVPLQAAAAEGDLTTVKTLLKAGAACSGERERDGQTPLHAAAVGGNLDVVTTLLKAKARRDVNKTTRVSRHSPLFYAVERGYGDIALALLRAGADVNEADANGWTPLMRATVDGKADLVNSLLLSGAPVNGRARDGSRPLHLAVEKGHLDVMKVLLKAGALTCFRRKADGKSALDLAVERADTDSMRELLAAGAVTGSANSEGLSALHIAAQEGHAEAVDVLVDAGADQNCRDDDDDTPLHLACSFLQPTSVRALLRRGAHESLLNDDDEAPGDIIGSELLDEGRDEEGVEWIREMLARAPSDRVWRRRGWLVMLNARHKGMQIKDQEEEAPSSSRPGPDLCDNSDDSFGAKRRRGSGAKGKEKLLLGHDSSHVHPSLGRFHSTVCKLLDVTDELVFRRIVSFL